MSETAIDALQRYHRTTVALLHACGGRVVVPPEAWDYADTADAVPQSVAYSDRHVVMSLPSFDLDKVVCVKTRDEVTIQRIVTDLGAVLGYDVSDEWVRAVLAVIEAQR